MAVDADLDLLIDAARAGGERVLDYWRKSPRVWEKPDDAGPVTEADFAVNDLLSARLRRARPDYGWLSEEGPDDPGRLGAERTFIIDPIDGTRAFIEESTDFALSLAIARAGVIEAAVVFLPARNSLYSARLGAQAQRDGQPIRASGRADLAGARLLAGRAALQPDYWRGGKPPAVERAFRSSIAYRLCLVAEGAFDGTLTLKPTWEWDSAAGGLIAAAAGARVTDRGGRDLVYNRPTPLNEGCVALAPALHDPVVRALLP